MEVQRTLSEWLDDLCVRFILNLPTHELAEFNRMGGHIEEAHWFYVDNIQKKDTKLPTLSLKSFSLLMLAHSPLTAHCPPETLARAFDHWRTYKSKIPVGGLILLNEAMDSILLVRGWKPGSSWMFPRGKIDEGEEDLACAVREAYEEVGFDAMAHGLIPKNGGLKKLEQHVNDQRVMLFVVPNVPMDFPFETQTTGEIGDIRWWKLADLPGYTRRKKGQDNAANAPKGIKLFQVSPFLGELNRWIKQQRKIKDRTHANHSNGHLSQTGAEDNMTEEEETLVEEEVYEAVHVHGSAETQEAATREIHRLLDMQLPLQGSQAAYSVEQTHLPPQRLQAATYGADQDKGRALLALLQQKHTTPQESVHIAQPNPQAPHAPVDHIYNVLQQPHTPQHHHPVQTVPPQGSHQVPPAFPTQPVQPDINSQLLSVLGIVKPTPDQAKWEEIPTQIHSQTQHHQQAANHQTFQHQQALNQQRAMDLASAAGIKHTPLSHPQPLPRQANHILTAAEPSPAGTINRSVQTQQQSQFAGSIPGPLNLPQQLVANLPKRPDVLDKNHLALLSAFKKAPSPTSIAASRDQLSQSSATKHPNQPYTSTTNASVLGSPYTGETRAHLAMQHDLGGTPMSHFSPQLAMTQAALRPRKATPSQQTALLAILSQSSGASPRAEIARPNLKENGVPNVASLEPDQQQQPPGFNATLEPPSTMPQGPSQGSSFPQLPCGAQRTAMRPKNVERTTPQPQLVSHSAQHLNAFRVDGASSDNRPQMLGSPLTAYAGGSPYRHSVSPAQVGLHTPLPRNPEANPQRQQALLSLFGKSPSAAAPVARHEERRPTPGSQAPISPENERFLLDYLKGVTNNAK